MFVKLPSGEVLNVLCREGTGAWAISCDWGRLPFYLDGDTLAAATRSEAPEGYAENVTAPRTPAAQKRYEMIAPLLQDKRCISDGKYRSALFKKIAEEHGTTEKRVKKLYCNYLATGSLVQRKPRGPKVRADYDDAIRKFYFSAKQNSLRTAYELMVLERYTNSAGELTEDVPTWASFKHYYERYWSKATQKVISRRGLSYYQRNERMLYGDAMEYRSAIGSYQVDETLADVYLVSKFDRSKVIGRPYIYLAVDTCTQLIAGVYVGLDAGETALLACIANAVSDKVQYCAGLGIEIAESDWPSRGMPSELITDKGGEFTGSRLQELCIRYGVEINTLPPFRAESKPLVERAMGLLQDSYKSMLQGKGGIGEDVNERWAIDYRQQAILTLEEFRQIVIVSIMNLNAGRVLNSRRYLPTESAKTPSALWNHCLNTGETSIIDVDEQEVYRRSLPRVTVKVSRKGLFYNAIRYLPPMGYVVHEGERVEVAYDAEDLQHLYLLDAQKNMVVCTAAKPEADTEKSDQEENRRVQRFELEHKVKMRKDILDIIDRAESMSIQGTDISDIQANRTIEKGRLS